MTILFWTGRDANDMTVRDVLAFNEYVEDKVEEQKELRRVATEEAIRNVLDDM